MRETKRASHRNWDFGRLATPYGCAILAAASQIGVLVAAAASDNRYRQWIEVFQQALAEEGWNDSNIRIDLRFATDNANEIRKEAAELVSRGPDVILAHGSSTIRPLQQLTRSIPIVFP